MQGRHGDAQTFPKGAVLQVHALRAVSRKNDLPMALPPAMMPPQQSWASPFWRGDVPGGFLHAVIPHTWRRGVLCVECIIAFMMEAVPRGPQSRPEKSPTLQHDISLRWTTTNGGKEGDEERAA